MLQQGLYMPSVFQLSPNPHRALAADGAGEQYEMDSSEADGEDEETFLELVSRPHSLRGEKA